MSILNLVTLALTASLGSAEPVAQPLPLTYDESYARFEALVHLVQKNIDPNVQYEVIPVPNFKNELRKESGIQLFYAPPKGVPRKLVVISSGIHGVEAPAGSFISQKLLQYCLKKIDRRETGFLLLHNMNPWGYQNLRRTNANNVDLNRNCFDHRKPFAGRTIANPTYDRLREVFEPRWPRDTWPMGLSIEIFGQLWLRGVSPLRAEDEVSAALSGQYNHPKGIYYGGSESQAECVEAQKRLLSIGSRYTSALHLDIHTGLGEYGINQIQANNDISETDLETFRKLFPERAKSPYRVVRSTGTGNTLLTHGDFTRSLCDMVPSLRPCLAATAEIGAFSGPRTIGALVNENSTYENPKIPKPLRDATVQELQYVFTPASDAKWVAAIRRNSEPFCDAIEEFIRQP